MLLHVFEIERKKRKHCFDVVHREELGLACLLAKLML